MTNQLIFSDCRIPSDPVRLLLQLKRSCRREESYRQPVSIRQSLLCPWQYLHNGENTKCECVICYRGLNCSFRHTDISSFQSWRIVNTITSNGHNGSKALETFDDDQFLLRRRSGENNFLIVSDIGSFKRYFERCATL